MERGLTYGVGAEKELPVFLRVAGAQLNLVVGDIAGNQKRIAHAMAWAEAEGCDVLVLSELAIGGYPPEDLVLRDDYVSANLDALESLAAQSGSVLTVVGFVDRVENHQGTDDAHHRSVANAAALICQGEVKGVYHKVHLPNYGVFDEDRYFIPGAEAAKLWRIGDIPIGVSVCEDAWLPGGPPVLQGLAGAEVLFNINASPYHQHKGDERTQLICDQAREAGAPLVYVNQVGGQDELVFDGGSMVVGADGSILYRALQFVEDRFWVDVEVSPNANIALPEVGRPEPRLEGVEFPDSAPRLTHEHEVYEALTVGLRDYVTKNGFSSVVIGLSGGIDSALTATVATDALGPEAVWGIAMPSRHNAGQSLIDARELADNLGCRFDVIEIEALFTTYLETLADLFSGSPFGVAEENLQARIRGALLMAVSNKFGPMVVTTGNKSEMAVGYATLYGDMVGGFSVLKDIFKQQVFALARWRNRNGVIIPVSSIEKPPSAELRPDQKDSDSLPPYEVLDPILERYVEGDESLTDIVRAGFEEEVVRRIIDLVDRNEYKRRQAPPGVKVTTKAFGRDRRLPITNGFRR